MLRKDSTVGSCNYIFKFCSFWNGNVTETSSPVNILTVKVKYGPLSCILNTIISNIGIIYMYSIYLIINPILFISYSNKMNSIYMNGIYWINFLRVSQIDHEFLEFYGSLQLCHERKKRKFFDEWRSIDDQPPLQSSLGIEPVIPQVATEEVRKHWHFTVPKTFSSDECFWKILTYQRAFAQKLFSNMRNCFFSSESVIERFFI